MALPPEAPLSGGIARGLAWSCAPADMEAVDTKIASD